MVCEAGSSLNKAKASRISSSVEAEMLFSFASLERGGCFWVEVGGGGAAERRLGGLRLVSCQILDARSRGVSGLPSWVCEEDGSRGLEYGRGLQVVIRLDGSSDLPVNLALVRNKAASVASWRPTYF